MKTNHESYKSFILDECLLKFYCANPVGGMSTEIFIVLIPSCNIYMAIMKFLPLVVQKCHLMVFWKEKFKCRTICLILWSYNPRVVIEIRLQLWKNTIYLGMLKFSITTVSSLAKTRACYLELEPNCTFIVLKRSISLSLSACFCSFRVRFLLRFHFSS